MKLLVIAFLGILASAAHVEADGTVTVWDTGYFLLTRWNPENHMTLFLHGVTLVGTSNFLKTRSSLVIIHGWQSDRFSEFIDELTEAYLEAGDYNIILVNWSGLASGSYDSALEKVPGVGADVAVKLNQMSTQNGLNLGTTRLMGWSLGFDIAEAAALELEGLQGVIQLTEGVVAPI